MLRFVIFLDMLLTAAIRKNDIVIETIPWPSLWQSEIQLDFITLSFRANIFRGVWLVELNNNNNIKLISCYGRFKHGLHILTSFSLNIVDEMLGLKDKKEKF